MDQELIGILDIARICHEANRAYCFGIGDSSQPPWDDAPEWQRHSAIEGVIFVIEHPHALPSVQHDKWMDEKRKDGWTYGEEKNAEKKTHPCLLPWEQLPKAQQVKDMLFKAIVDAVCPMGV